MHIIMQIVQDSTKPVDCYVINKYQLLQAVLLYTHADVCTCIDTYCLLCITLRWCYDFRTANKYEGKAMNKL